MGDSAHESCIDLLYVLYVNFVTYPIEKDKFKCSLTQVSHSMMTYSIQKDTFKCSLPDSSLGVT